MKNGLLHTLSRTLVRGCDVGNKSRLAARLTCTPSVSQEADQFHRVIQGVDYWHNRFADGGEIFLTLHGRAFAENLKPENWFVAGWFAANRRRLRGTSAVYKVATRPVNGRSLQLVVRFSRVGEAVPVDTASNESFLHAEFSTPFEEVANVMQLRAARFGRGRRRILTKRPLAIYLPPELLRPWQIGRSEDKIAAKQARFPDMEIDPRRQYVLVYGWIDGMDAEEAADQLGLEGDKRLKFMEGVAAIATHELAEAGFRMADMKPAHVIVRLRPAGSLLCRADGRLAYALVDYELLERIPEERK